MQAVIHVIFWGPRWPGNWASEAIIQHTSKSSSNWYVNYGWCETSGNCWENVQRPEILLILASKVAQILDLWHIQNYSQWTCEAILIWNRWKCFEEVTKVQNVYLLKAPKCPKNRAFGAHIININKGSSSGLNKQYWCESRGSFLTKLC